MKTVVRWAPVAWIPVVWLAFYYWFIASSSPSHPVLLWGVGTLIVWQIVIFVHNDAPGPVSPNTPSYPVAVTIIAAIILFLGMIAGWLATTPGLARVIAAVLIGLENLFVYKNLDEDLRNPWLWRSVEWSFAPIIMLGLAGLFELAVQIQRFIGAC